MQTVLPPIAPGIHVHPVDRARGSRRHPALRLGIGAAFAMAVLPPAAMAQPEVKQHTLAIAASDECMPLIQRLADTYSKQREFNSVGLETAPERWPLQALLRGGGKDLLALARPLTMNERDRFLAEGQPPILGVPVAITSVVLVVHPQNRCRELTVDQAGTVLLSAVRQWTQLGVRGPVVAGEAARGDGGNSNLEPAEHEAHGDDGHGHAEDEAPRVAVYRPEPTSDVAMALAGRTLQGADLVPFRDGLALETVESRVAADPLGIGITRFGPVRGLKSLAIVPRSGGNAILPTSENLRERKYPLTHFVYIFLRTDAGEEARAFVDFATSTAGQKIVGETERFLPVVEPPSSDLP